MFWKAGVASSTRFQTPPRRVTDLRDITYALGIKNEAIKETIIASIKAELDLRPELRNNARFAGLYSSGGQKRSAPGDENVFEPQVQPSATRRRLDIPRNAVAGPSCYNFGPPPQPKFDHTPNSTHITHHSRYRTLIMTTAVT